MSLDHAVRTYRNLIAILIVVLILGLMLLLGGCSTIKMERGVDYEKITVRAPPKDFKSLNFKWHDTHLRAGEAATSDQPWADVVGDYSGVLLNMRRSQNIISSYCKEYPVKE